MIERESDTFRRGLTLGLTLAEVFILILFLALLVLLALHTVNIETKEKFEGTKTELEQTQSRLVQTTTALETNIDRLEAEQNRLAINVRSLNLQKELLTQSLEDEQQEHTTTIASLKKSEIQRQEVEQTLEEVERQLAQTTRRLEEERALLRSNIEKLNRAMEEAQAALLAAREEGTATKVQLQQVEQQRAAEQAGATQTIGSLEQTLVQSLSKTTQLTEQLEQLRQGNTKLREALYAKKGIDPPCWYEVTERQGDRYEKTHYLMDIAVYDQYLRVRMNPVPSGYAVDEYGNRAATSYAEEYLSLPISPLRMNQDISLQEFEAITTPILRRGKDKKIRKYSCVFYVRVWDLTSSNAKQRWQEAVDSIGRSFYITRVREDPWAY